MRTLLSRGRTLGQLHHTPNSARRACSWQRHGERVQLRPKQPLTSFLQFRRLNCSAPALANRSAGDGLDSTIFALSSAPGRAAIAVIRVSGPACIQIYEKLCPGRAVPRPRYAALRTLYDPRETPSPDTVIDPGALVLFFPGPRTVTGEDVLELHVHGGPAVVKAVLAAIPRCIPADADATDVPQSSICYAEPGEFTRRAFLNDRLGLTQIEALGDTLTATTEQQRRLSTRGTTGVLTKRYEAWRQMLLHARGELEALIDFSEDQHFDESPAELASSVVKQVKGLSRQINAHCTNASRGELLRNGISLSLLGAPNAGKSSLLNRIVGREAAIVSAEAGTTRDIVEVGLDLGGWYCRLGDMAGIRVNKRDNKVDFLSQSSEVGAVEREGIKRAKARAIDSDVVIVVLSLEPDHETGSLALAMDPEVVATARSVLERSGSVVVAINKTDQLHDLLARPTEDWIEHVTDAIPGLSRDCIFEISCREAAQGMHQGSDPGGIQVFLNGLISVFQDLTSPLIPSNDDFDLGEADKSMWAESLGTNARQRTLLEACLHHLDLFVRAVSTSSRDGTGMEHEEREEIDIVVAAENLRLAAACLGKITGKGDAGDVEEVLGVVFEKFCVGK